MRDFKEFLNGDVVVTFSSEEEVKEFLKLCESKNITWGYSDPAATAYTPDFKSDGIRFDRYDRCMWRGSLRNYRDRGIYEFVSSTEFSIVEERIELFRSKNTVVCLKKVGGKVVGRGKAKCCPSDTFDFDYGAELAFERMLGKKSVKIPKIVKQKLYCVGDIVLIKNKWKSSIAVPPMDFMLGNAYEVVEYQGERNIKDGHQYRLKVCSGDIKSFDDYWDVCHSDIKGKVVLI